ncbi:MAG: hypothetical protein CMF23_13175 [Ignavibacteriae bacterium]|nr:hypothetical protein [Ignavibacteriota bacterium]|tara:strand:- start:17 stop:454 length:438 start_codon:yes stop_codon:yes gene_type:complete
MAKLVSLRITFIIVLLSLLITSGCADKIVSECDCDPIINVGNFTTFSDIQKNVFDINCTTSGCHGTEFTQANLVLVEGQSYTNLYDVQSFLYPGSKRVVPGDSENSLLIKVLKGDGVPQMPPTGKIDNALIDSVAAWIDRGALPE